MHREAKLLLILLLPMASYYPASSCVLPETVVDWFTGVETGCGPRGLCRQYVPPARAASTVQHRGPPNTAFLADQALTTRSANTSTNASALVVPHWCKCVYLWRHTSASVAAFSGDLKTRPSTWPNGTAPDLNSGWFPPSWQQPPSSALVNHTSNDWDSMCGELSAVGVVNAVLFTANLVVCFCVFIIGSTMVCSLRKLSTKRCLKIRNMRPILCCTANALVLLLHSLIMSLRVVTNSFEPYNFLADPVVVLLSSFLIYTLLAVAFSWLEAMANSKAFRRKTPRKYIWAKRAFVGTVGGYTAVVSLVFFGVLRDYRLGTVLISLAVVPVVFLYILGACRIRTAAGRRIQSTIMRRKSKTCPF